MPSKRPVMLKAGDIIGLKVRLLWSGWKGLGIVTEDQYSEGVKFQAIGPGAPSGTCLAVRSEVVKKRKYKFPATPAMSAGFSFLET